MNGQVNQRVPIIAGHRAARPVGHKIILTNDGRGSDRPCHFGQWMGCHNWVLIFWLLCLFKTRYLWYNGVIWDTIYALCYRGKERKKTIGVIPRYGQKFGSKMRFCDSWHILDSWVRVLPVCPFWIWNMLWAAVADSRRGQLLESGVKSKRCKREVLELKNFKNRDISFLTRIVGRMTPIGIFFLFFF